MDALVVAFQVLILTITYILWRKTMTGFQNLTAAVAALSTEVDADMVALQKVPTDANFQALADTINAQTTKLAAARASIT